MRMLASTLLFLVLVVLYSAVTQSDSTFGFSSARIVYDKCANAISKMQFNPPLVVEYDEFFQYPPSDYMHYPQIELTDKQRETIRRTNRILKKARQDTTNRAWIAVKQGVREVKKHVTSFLESAMQFVSSVFDWFCTPVITVKCKT